MASDVPRLVANLAVLLLVVAAQTLRAEVKQKLYLIEGHKVASEVSAAGQLRNFLSANLSPHQRCQRYSILLNSYQRKKNTLTSFQIAEIGTLRGEDVEKRFNGFDIETLRDLYINSVQKYLDAGQVDGAMVELYRCLSTGFRDAKARSFLNNDEVKRIVDQYESIVEQPVRLLLREQQVKHPQLKLEDLHPTVSASVAQWFPDDAKALERMFAHRVLRTTERSKPAPAATTVAAEAHAQAGAQSQEDAHAHTKAGPHAQANAQVEVQAAAAATPADASEAEIDDDDHALLGYVFGSIIATYESVPLETSLSERCRAYSQVVEAAREDLLRANYVDELVRGVAENLGKQQTNAAAAEPFVPDQTKRENFLFVLQTLDPLQGGHEAWTDMVDCVGQWEAVDPEAAQFMHSPELAQTFEQMLSLTGEPAPAPADPAAEAQAAAAVAGASTAAVRDAPPTGQPATPHVAQT